ncbi:hypothetical protein ElyMa_004584800 [Elysia marginata]|uniref:Uncharacterized protein n=1 Tax=Elysia marginata TaxID=1093978 RepID=A0AAV4HX73_9GAST|nr:hypothetical protein ElyMa_004584800 [Elysia marginata]
MRSFFSKIVAHNRSRSPSPVSRNRSSQRGSIMSEAEDTGSALAAAAFRTFGSDGRPRRGSTRRSSELERPDSGKPPSSGGNPPTHVYQAGGSDFLQVESGPQPIVSVVGSEESTRPREVYVPIPVKSGRQSPGVAEEADSGKPSSPEDILSTSSGEDSKRYGREDSLGFATASVDAAGKSRSNTSKSSNSNASLPSVKELVPPSEFKETVNGGKHVLNSSGELHV